MIQPIKWKSKAEILSAEELGRIHQASLDVLQQTGIEIELPLQRETAFLDQGLTYDRNLKRLFFPASVVEKALKLIHTGYTLAARNPANDLLVDGNYGYLSLDGSGLEVEDLETGQIRPSTWQDLADATLVADSLPQIAFLWPCISARGCPSATQPLHELYAMLKHSDKHVQAMTAVNPLNAKGTIEIAACVAGGLDKLRQRPIISNFQCSLSPLAYEQNSMEAAFLFAEAGIPTGFVCMPISCSTAPATVAGAMVLSNAEVLAGIVMLQLVYPGAPTFYGICTTAMELQRGGVTCGGPEDVLFQAAGCQLAQYYGLPSNIGTLATGAKASDWQAGMENAFSGLVSSLCHADMMCGAGLLKGATSFSYQQLLHDCDIYDIMKRVAEGIEISDASLAVEIINRVGPNNHYLLEDHTLNHMRQLWQPHSFERAGSAIQRSAAESRAHLQEKIRHILANHRPQPLGEEKAILEIIASYEKK